MRRAGREADSLAVFLEARRREKARLSRLLHDEIGQILSAVGLQLDLLRMDCQQLSGVAARFSEVQKLLEQAVAQVRDLSYELNPSVVEQIGLQAALERLITRHRKSFGGSLELFWDRAARLPEPAAQACYQIIEQALEDGVRVPGVRRLRVSLESKPHGVQLEVCHDGSEAAGDGAAAPEPTVSWRLMQHYARAAGLVLSLAKDPGRGTIVRAVYPRPEPKPADASARRRRSGG